MIDLRSPDATLSEYAQRANCGGVVWGIGNAARVGGQGGLVAAYPGVGDAAVRGIAPR